MQLIEFLKNYNNLENNKILIFRAENYSALFFSTLLNILKKKFNNFKSISIDQLTKDEINSYFSITFLGSNYFYWLKDLFLAEDADSKYWRDFISTYNGDHIFGFYLPKNTEISTLNNSLIIDLPNLINPELYKELNLLINNYVVDNNFINKLFKSQKVITLDNSCKIMAYNNILGKNYDIFFDSWFDKIISPDKSLFLLSQYLFAQDKTEFFKYWSKIKQDYSPEFWPVYWSDQITQASIFVSTVEQKSYIEAKKIITRLPFSFINKDYKKYNFNFLAQSHNFLYQIDYNLKNSLGEYSFDIWYNKFFIKNF